jgi:hypothetical protein
MRYGRTALLVVTSCALLGAAERPAPSVPASLAAYRSWWQPQEQPVAVPTQLWELCVAPSIRSHGPHVDRFVRLYINPIGQAAFRDGSSSFPEGTVIAKEKLLAADSQNPEGIGVMVKHASTSAFSSSGGWQFLYFPEAGTRAQVQEHCARCHQNADKRDYVFARLGRQQ